MINAEPQEQGTPLWKVGVPTQTQLFDQQRGAVAAWNVPVHFGDGSSITLTVAASDFTPQKLQQLIEQHVDNLMQIRSLEGPRY